jgi:hypothetical protein
MSAYPTATNDPHSRQQPGRTAGGGGGGGDGELPLEAPQAASSRLSFAPQVITPNTVRKELFVFLCPI